MNCQILISEKIKKNANLSSAEFAKRVVKVKTAISPFHLHLNTIPLELLAGMTNLTVSNLNLAKNLLAGTEHFLQDSMCAQCR